MVFKIIYNRKGKKKPKQDTNLFKKEKWIKRGMVHEKNKKKIKEIKKKKFLSQGEKKILLKEFK